MREFVYFSGKAWTTGNFKDLMKAGRMDIVIHFLINSFFVSHHVREDVKLHLVLYGPPTPPRHIEIIIKKKVPGTGKEEGSLDISKKDVGGLIKRILYKYKEGKKVEVFPGCFIEKKTLSNVLNEISKEKQVYILDEKGEDIKKEEFGEDVAFVIGDHEGFPVKELKRMKKEYKTISLGKIVYFASQVATILNYELDKKFG